MGGPSLTLTSPTVVGIVNVTPDSFSDGGRFARADDAVVHGLGLLAQGAHVLDVGGESTRPGADPVPAEEELSRVVPVIRALRSRVDTPISIDTRKPEVARAAMAAGATIWNDVSALTYAEDSVATAASLRVPVILMHAQGDPRTMQAAPTYIDVVQEVCDFLRARRDAAVVAGVAEADIILDPGIGFGKTVAHNVALMKGLDTLVALGAPVLLGASRKRFIASLDRDEGAETRLGGSIAAVLAARARGASWFRVHDVAATRQALAVWDAITRHIS